MREKKEKKEKRGAGSKIQPCVGC